jgi:hypothetical protein
MHGKKATLGIVILAVTALPALAAEGRIPIPFTSTYSTPIVISESGSYVVTRDLEPTGPGPIIEINNGDVDLDLNGMTLRNLAYFDDPLIRVVPTMGVKIHDGRLRGGLNGIYGGASVIEDVRISGSAESGIHLINALNFMIRRNLITYTGGPAIHVEQPVVKGGTIEENEIRDCQDGIAIYVAWGLRISNNRLTLIQDEGIYGAAIYLEWSDGCMVSVVPRSTSSGRTVAWSRGTSFRGNAPAGTHSWTGFDWGSTARDASCETTSSATSGTRESTWKAPAGWAR